MFITTAGGGMIASTVLGGLLGGSDSGSEQTQTRSMDPRMDRFVYGSDGKSGLLGTGYNLMNQQLATGGLNPMQQRGLNMQAQFLQSPQYQQGYQNMMNMGQSLMGRGVAGNPYTQGGMRGSMNQYMQPMQNMGQMREQRPRAIGLDQPMQQALTVEPQVLQKQTAPEQQTVEEIIADYLKKQGIQKPTSYYDGEMGVWVENKG